MRGVRDDAIVTSTVAVGEADLVVRLFLRDHGRLAAFARGARKSRRRFRVIAPLARGAVVVTERRDDALFTLDEADLSVDVDALGRDARTLGRASYLTELVERFVHEGAPAPRAFTALLGAVDALADGRTAPALVMRAFELVLLDEGGWLPDLSVAADDPGAPVTAFDPVDGVLLAHGHARTVPFDEGARAAARALLSARSFDGAPPVDDATLRVVGRLFAAHLRRAGGPPLKSIAFLRSLDG